MNKRFKFMWFIVPIFIILVACAPTNEKADSSKPQIVTSISPMYEITKAIAGDRAEVSLMVGANEDAHHYEPSAQAVASVNEAEVFIYSSKVMEFWVDSLLNVVENDSLQVVELAEDLDLAIADEHDHEHDEHEDHDGHNHGGVDPHFWLDPVTIQQQLSIITDALGAVDPEGIEIYEQNAEAFSKELTVLDDAYQTAFNQATHRAFVVQHQAFGHLAHRYHLEQVAVGGLTTEVEPAPRQLAQITDFIKEQGVPVIYYQSGENSAIAETLAEETKTEIAVLHDLESVPRGLDSKNNLYLEAMYQNLEQLKLSIQ